MYYSSGNWGPRKGLGQFDTIAKALGGTLVALFGSKDERDKLKLKGKQDALKSKLEIAETQAAIERSKLTYLTIGTAVVGMVVIVAVVASIAKKK